MNIHTFIAQRDGVKDQVEIVAVVIHLGNMRITDGIFHGQRMEVIELAQHQIALIGGRIHQVDPDARLVVADGAG